MANIKFYIILTIIFVFFLFVGIGLYGYSIYLNYKLKELGEKGVDNGHDAGYVYGYDNLQLRKDRSLISGLSLIIVDAIAILSSWIVYIITSKGDKVKNEEDETNRKYVEEEMKKLSQDFNLW